MLLFASTEATGELRAWEVRSGKLEDRRASVKRRGEGRGVEEEEEEEEERSASIAEELAIGGGDAGEEMEMEEAGFIGGLCAHQSTVVALCAVHSSSGRCAVQVPSICHGRRLEVSSSRF